METRRIAVLSFDLHWIQARSVRSRKERLEAQRVASSEFEPESPALQSSGSKEHPVDDATVARVR
jgi:hypothetical protein